MGALPASFEPSGTGNQPAGAIALAAKRLRDAYALGPVAPLRDLLDPLDGESAYRVQALNAAYWQAAGRTRAGWKIGLTSAAVQAQLGVDCPDFGMLFDDMAIPDGGSIDASQLLQPRIEAEIAFVLGREIDDPSITTQGIAGAIDHAVAALEIVDSRIAGWKITFADTVADNGSSSLFVLGSSRRSIVGLDLWSCGMVLEVDDVVVSTGAGAACLGHPLNAAAWLARLHCERGVPLRAGDVILTGALGPMVQLTPGSRVRAAIAGLGDVSCAVLESRS